MYETMTQRRTARKLWATCLIAVLASLGPICGADRLFAADLRVDFKAIDAFARQHCADCHEGESSAAGFDLFHLNRDLADPASMAKWIRVFDRVRTHEMPPSDVEAPDESERQQFLERLGKPLTEAHAANKGTVLRRLNRREYENTLNDLFGTHLSLSRTLPTDGRTGEFDNVGESLSVSMVQMRRYLEAADAVMDAAIASTLEPPESRVVKASYAETRGAENFLGNQWLKLDDGAVVFFRALGYPSGMLREANVRTSGRYRVRVTGYAYQSEHPVTFAIGATTFARGAERPTFSYHAFPPGKPTTVEIEAWIEANYMIEVTPWGIADRDNEIRQHGIEKYTGPGLAVLSIEVEGPLIDEFPSRGHRLIFDGLNRAEVQPGNPNDRKRPWYKPRFEVRSDQPVAEASTVLQRVASKAFRRRVGSDSVQPYVGLFERTLQEGASFEDALKTSIAAILCSPDFLYFREPRGRLDDDALAARLSYFLTRSLPDDELSEAAANGELNDNPRGLVMQVDRLLADPRSDRFIVDFTDAWLNLRDIEFTNPDDQLFPEFDQFLQYSMLAETRAYFRELIQQNLPARSIVKSDFAMLNNRLAIHYGIPDVEGPEMRRIALPPDSVRGGFLSQASVLKVSANGTNTSPVVRGAWVLERILGEPPPPPPPGIPGVEPDIRGASTLRELLDKHRSVVTCNGCHRKIDPPGFALESFNPIGGWRDRFRSLGEGERVDVSVHGRKVRYRLGQPVDASGQLPTGQSFSGFSEFRDLLAEQDLLLARAFVTKLLVFATGREMGFSDRPEIERIITEAAGSGYGIRDLLHAVVQSEIFRSR